MTAETFALLEMALDAAGLVVCLTVLIHVVRRRFVFMPDLSVPRRRPSPAVDFTAEMRLQTAQQQAETTLAALNAAVAAATAAGAPAGGAAPPEPVDFRAAPAPPPQAPSPAPPPFPEAAAYATVRKLAAQGLDVDAIYQRLRIPKGEIRLALHLGEGGTRRLRASA